MISIGGQLRGDQLSLFVVNEEPVFVRDEERIPPAAFSGRFERFPKPLACFRIQATQLSEDADTVDVLAVKVRSTHQYVEVISVNFAVAASFPDLLAFSNRRQQR